MRPDGIERLQLPLSGWVFETRPDGRWREISPAQYADELSGDFVPSPDEWAEPGNFGVTGGCERWPDHPNAREGWWLMYGCATSGPTVRLSDGQRPPVITFGPLWVCEWRSTWLVAEVCMPHEVVRMFDHRPAYLDGHPEG